MEVMEDQYKTLMKMLGYDVDKKGFIMFVGVLDSVRDLLKEDRSSDEIVALLPNLFLDQYHYNFCLEMDKNKYMELLNEFVNSRKVTSKNQQLNRCFKLDKENLSLEQALIYFAEYFNYIERIDEHTKKMIKRYSSNGETLQ